MSALHMVANNHAFERSRAKRGSELILQTNRHDVGFPKEPAPDSNERDSGCFKQEEECGSEPKETGKSPRDQQRPTPKSTV